MKYEKQLDAVDTERRTEGEPGRQPGDRNLVDFMRESPLAEALADHELDLSREEDYGRDIEI
jgi:hypothetical protein